MSVQYVPFRNSGSMLLPPNHTLVFGQFLLSENGRFKLQLKADGNLVVEQDGGRFGLQMEISHLVSQ